MFSPHFVLTPALVVKAIYVHGFGLNRLEIQEEESTEQGGPASLT